MDWFLAFLCLLLHFFPLSFLLDQLLLWLIISSPLLSNSILIETFHWNVYCWMKKVKNSVSFWFLLSSWARFFWTASESSPFSCSKALVLIRPFYSKSRLLQSVDGLLNQHFHDQWIGCFFSPEPIMWNLTRILIYFNFSLNSWHYWAFPSHHHFFCCKKWARAEGSLHTDDFD
jgi:hypothetical protein